MLIFVGLVLIVAWCIAMIDTVGALFGQWSVVGDGRHLVFGFEITTLMLLLFVSVMIRRWVYLQSDSKKLRKIANFSLASLSLCMVGDVINFNLREQFYRHGEIIKHDYLADSVWFFAPGYILLIMAVFSAINHFEALSRKKTQESVIHSHSGLYHIGHHFKLYILAIVAIVVGGSAFMSMYLPETGLYISVLTALHSIVITAVAVSAMMMIYSVGVKNMSTGLWCVVCGLLLAALADAIIGQYWIYGAQGEGFFPQVRYINWAVYITSQCFVILLPYYVVQHTKKAINTV
ncbi:hypothetical protein [Pseudoalteromonas sp. MMG005]|uniref:hypothetical protein n=1 Tax=Pseudoalteromonas sp. MMG005 TaxID=2822682 RepID=UPI001B39D711|nr:hypothetical protein [Pseudoalteromonas sp. MMG005]MBQ4845470.1 hypothetical protein [Pseudoalteromonas sp. MMG005]